MLSRLQAIRSAQDLDVPNAEELLDAARAGWRLRSCCEGEVATVVVGGDPLYLEDDRWPVNEHGVRLSLIGRVDCARLPALPADWPPAPAWRHHGARLDLFADREFGGPTVSVIQRPSQAGSSDLDGGTACTAVPCISLPTLPDEALGDDLDACETYERWRWMIAHDNAPPATADGLSTLLGAPHSIQDDVLEIAASHHRPDGLDPTPGLDAPGRWQVVLHLATDPDIGFEYGGGALTILVPRSRLGDRPL